MLRICTQPVSAKQTHFDGKVLPRIRRIGQARCVRCSPSPKIENKNIKKRGQRVSVLVCIYTLFLRDDVFSNPIGL